MVARNYFREILCSEKMLPVINYKEKMFLKNNYSLYFGSQSFVMKLFLLFH